MEEDGGRGGSERGERRVNLVLNDEIYIFFCFFPESESFITFMDSNLEL